jgi:hypothetical protein
MSPQPSAIWDQAAFWFSLSCSSCSSVKSRINRKDVNDNASSWPSWSHKQAL